MNNLKIGQKLNIVNSTEGGIVDSFPCMTLKEAKEMIKKMISEGWED